jgi:hypothetical protein
MADQEPFTETTTMLASAVPCDPGLVRLYADHDWIECQKLPGGVRLFRRSAAAEVRKIRAQRLARRGGRRNPRAATV